MSRKVKSHKSVETLKHREAKRKNIPTAEYQSVLKPEDATPRPLKYPRNPDLDPQLVWRGKDEQDWSDLVVPAPPLYIQEKIHPKILIDDLLRESAANGQRPVASGKSANEAGQSPATSHQTLFTELFADFNGIPKGADKTEFYAHDQNWSNRMILGDSLQVMASLAEREGLRGKVQCIYLDPPYGIKFNSNFQWSTTSRDVKDGKADHITREPEQVKAFRDTWRDGIHSYLTYLRDRLTVARDLLKESGSIFVQIGDENVHRVRAVMDEVFGEDNFLSQISFKKTGYQAALNLPNNFDYILWYASSRQNLKFRRPYMDKLDSSAFVGQDIWLDDREGERRRLTSVEKRDLTSFNPNNIFRHKPPESAGASARDEKLHFRGRELHPKDGKHYSTHPNGMGRLRMADRLLLMGNSLRYIEYLSGFSITPQTNVWLDTVVSGFNDPQIYVVQTTDKVIQRCLLMSTDPGDLVLDPTCGSGTTAYVAEQWGRRWVTIDTSRVALALARARIMGARYPYYLLADSREGQIKEAEVTRSVPSSAPTYGNISLGFVYERVPHITLKSIANNTEIDVIWEKFEAKLAPLRDDLTHALPAGWLAAYRAKQKYTAEVPPEIAEWEVPREPSANWSSEAKALVAEFWKLRIARQKEIDASIAAKADFEYLYDKPYEDKSKVRVAGPFTVESLSPHRMLGVDENDELLDPLKEDSPEYGAKQSFPQMILENLKTAGVQQAHKEDRITFTSLTPWPGALVCAEGRYMEGEQEKRAAIFIGPEFGTVQRADLVAAAREAGDAGFEVLIACAFNYEAHATEFSKLGRIPVLKARMNADLHMAGELKNTGKGNLFVIFGEPDVAVTSGLWLVARGGRLVANYECIKELSGLGSLEEINRLGATDLRGFKRLSAGRTLRSDQSGAAGGDIGAVQYRGRSGQNGDGRISSESERGSRLAGGGGDAVVDRASSGDAAGGSAERTPAAIGGNRQNAQRTQALAGIEALTPADFPLSLTTSHYTQITVRGVDVFKPQTGEVVSDGADGIACWFIDTDYNEESFFVRQAYFLGTNDPYSALKTTLKAEINADAWATLRSDTSRPFERPKKGRIAVKVINHLGDEVMKVFKV